jgi:hypothetical protein
VRIDILENKMQHRTEKSDFDKLRSNVSLLPSKEEFRAQAKKIDDSLKKFSDLSDHISSEISKCTEVISCYD